MSTPSARPAADPVGRRSPVGLWRRSIQARVVISTLLLSALVVTLVGLAMLQQVSDGLVEQRVESSLAEASRGTVEAQRRLSGASGTEVDSGTQLTQLVAGIVQRGQVQGYEVVLVGPVRGSGDGRTSLAADSGTRSSQGVLARSVPGRLSRRVEVTGFSGVASTFSEIRYQESGVARRSVPGVVTGSQLLLPADGGTYTLYYLFPMTEEAQTLAVVRGALLTGGALLLVLEAGLTWLVTRQVVSPVRLVRRVAERLASGRLEERMHVRGEDDIARLGQSFNQMATSLQQQIRRLEELSRVQRRFVSDVSHELRTPLTTVRMAGDVLYDARERFDPVTARSAELLQHELDRFELLLTDLLEISRFDAGAANLELEDVDLAGVARRVRDSTRALAERRDTVVVVRDPAEDGAPAVAQCDVRRVERIVRNLVTNAIDYSESDRIEIRLAADGHAAALAVRDHGVGLRPEEAVLVFNRFWRADPARARTTGGTGLGLSISLEDARLHGGLLQAWGEPGRGSQFLLTLPRRAGDALERSPLPLEPVDATPARADRSAGATSGEGPVGRAAGTDRPARRTVPR